MADFDFKTSWFNSNLIKWIGISFARLRTLNMSVGQQQILDGVGFDSNWLEQNIATGTSRFAVFTVPSGFKMILAFRHLNPSGDSFLYRVYPQGTYTLGVAKTDDAHNFAKTRNLRQDSTFTGQWLVRYNVTTPPAETSQIIYEPVWGQINAGNRSVGTLENDDSYLILSGNQQFLLEMKNSGTTNPMNAQVSLQYAFIPEDRVSPLD